MAADAAPQHTDGCWTAELRYRAASLDDVLLLARLNHELIQDEGHRNPMTLAQLEGRMRGWLAAEHRAALFEREGAAVAYVLYSADGPSIHVRHVYVVRSLRRQGIGAHVMRYLAGHVWPSDARVTLDVLVGNKGAQAFYESLGFAPYALTLEIEGDALAAGSPARRGKETAPA
jgi:GNAT superfamily N-acetyltransferase